MCAHVHAQRQRQTETYRWTNRQISFGLRAKFSEKVVNREDVCIPAGGVGRASQKQCLDEEGDLPEEELSCEGSCRAGEEVRQVLLNPMPGPESRVWILGKAGMKVRQDTKPRS